MAKLVENHAVCHRKTPTRYISARSAKIPYVPFPDQGFGRGKVIGAGLCKGCWFLLSRALERMHVPLEHLVPVTRLEILESNVVKRINK